MSERGNGKQRPQLTRTNFLYFASVTIFGIQLVCRYLSFCVFENRRADVRSGA